MSVDDDGMIFNVLSKVKSLFYTKKDNVIIT